MTEEEGANLSDDDDFIEENIYSGLPEIHGTLSKWTNYIHGWQDRFVILKQGTLSYYKSEDDVEFGCRGAVSLSKAVITPHELDELRFDVTVNDNAWYLRTNTDRERFRWMETLDFYKSCRINNANSNGSNDDSGFGSENSLLLKRQPSSLSITSGTSLSSYSACSVKRGLGLREKLAEMETFRDILNHQIDNLQHYFDSCLRLNHPPCGNGCNNRLRPNVIGESVCTHYENGFKPDDDSDTFNSFSANNIGNATKSQSSQPLATHRRTPSLPVTSILSKIDLFGAGSLIREKFNRSLFGECDKPHSERVEDEPTVDTRLIEHFENNGTASNGEEGLSANDITLTTAEDRPLKRKNGYWPQSLDFKGEAFTFKATTSGLIATLSHCIDILYQREEHWKKKLEKEVEKRKKLEELCNQAQNFNLKKTMIFGGPDFEEGPHCAIKEEEFFDAVETTLDKLDKEENELKHRQQLASKQSASYHSAISKLSHPSQKTHRLSGEVDRIFAEQLAIAQVDPLSYLRDDRWQLIAEEGDMKIYKRELEEEGLVCDPLKAIHIVQGVTAKEVCHYFFDPNYRHDWETTLETMKILEVLSEDTLVFHQIHKRIWPATQRDSCFWSHIKNVSQSSLSEEGNTKCLDTWSVCNYSNDHPQAIDNNCIRVKLAVFLHCQTIVDNPPGGSHDINFANINRKNVKCKITYCSKINPGGWTPPSVLRAVYKREYPKFLKKFTSYVKDMTKNKELLF
ncbi:unnamed protein product [Gordionus sp. m RMFG-2023]